MHPGRPAARLPVAPAQTVDQHFVDLVVSFAVDPVDSDHFAVQRFVDPALSHHPVAQTAAGLAATDPADSGPVGFVDSAAVGPAVP